MFGYYGDPYWVYRRPRLYYPRRNFVDRYLAAVEDALGDLFEADRCAEACSGKEEQAQAKPEGEEKGTCEGKDKAESEVKPVQKPKRLVAPRQSYFYESRSRYDGHDYVEEHRERVSDADGEHTTLRRRLGDRWYETETHTDKDGKSTSKETWHNVGEDDIESFKAEWEAKHGQKYAPVKDETTSAPAVEHKPEEPKKEESQ